MSTPKPEQFAEFYQAANGFPPFPWQTRLAQRLAPLPHRGRGCRAQ